MPSDPSERRSDTAAGATPEPDPVDPARLAALDHELSVAIARRRKADDKGPPDGGRSEGLGAGMRIAVEMAAAIGIGVAIGVLLDRWLGTTPWLLLLFFVIGFAAAILNVYRTAQELDRKAKARKAGERADETGSDTR